MYFIDVAQWYMVLKIDYFLACEKNSQLAFREHFKPSVFFVPYANVAQPG